MLAWSLRSRKETDHEQESTQEARATKKAKLKPVIERARGGSAAGRGGPGGRLSERQLRWELVRGGTSPAKAFQGEDGARAWPLRWDGLDAEERQGVTPAASDASPVLTGALCQCPQ